MLCGEICINLITKLLGSNPPPPPKKTILVINYHVI